jgi:surface protein
MGFMFAGCQSLKSLDLSSFNTTNVNNMESMFYLCKSLKLLDLSSFDSTNVSNMILMFSYCSSLKKENVKISNNGKRILDEDCWN